jgi:hypothetical protein
MAVWQLLQAECSHTEVAAEVISFALLNIQVDGIYMT